jgi:hypothetical protein
LPLPDRLLARRPIDSSRIGPDFGDQEALAGPPAEVRYRQGRLLGRMESLEVFG